MTEEQLWMMEKQRQIQEEHHSIQETCLAQSNTTKKKKICSAAFSERLGLGFIKVGKQFLWYAE